MALDVMELNDQTLSDIMDNLETEDENDVAKLSAGEAFDRFLIWNGIQGFTGMILEAADSIRTASAISEIRALVNPPDGADINADSIFTEVVDVFDSYGHMGNSTLTLVGHTLRMATNPTGKALALLKVRELLN